jgi:hypothetical protein
MKIGHRAGQYALIGPVLGDFELRAIWNGTFSIHGSNTIFNDETPTPAGSLALPDESCQQKTM